MLTEKKGLGNVVVFLSKMVWRFSKGNHHNVLLYCSMEGVAKIFLAIANPFLWSTLFSTLQNEGIGLSNILWLLTLASLTLVADQIFWALHGPGRVMETMNAFGVRATYKKHLLWGVLALPPTWHQDHHTGDTIDKVEKGTTGLHSFSETTFEVIYAIAQLIIGLGGLYYLNRTAGHIETIVVIAAIYCTVRFDGILIPQNGLLNKAENLITQKISDAISNITTVIILRFERQVYGTIEKTIDEPRNLARSNSVTNEFKWYLNTMCCSGGPVLVFGGYFLEHPGAVDMGMIMYIYQYLRNIGGLFFEFTSLYGHILKYATRVMNSEELAKDFTREGLTNHVLPTNWKRIRMEDMEFAYEDEGDAHLEIDDFVIERGKFYACVGPSGGGKTTFFKILRAVHPTRKLRLSVDDTLIEEGFYGICRGVCLVPQNPELFTDTIRNNVTLWTNADDKTVRRFTDLACVTETIDALPHGFDSSIKEKGVNLSGGQKQRIALARGLFAAQGHSMVLLDEPTSSVDEQNEGVIFDNLETVRHDKAVFVSVHGTHLLPRFDEVIFFENGKIVAKGPYNHLLATSSRFSEFCSASKRENDRSLTN